MEREACPYCDTAKALVRAGRNPSGSQRHQCRACRRYVTLQRKPMGYEAERKERALQLYLEGMSQRAIGRVLHVNHQTVANWLRAYATQLPQAVSDPNPTTVVEVDELVSFVGKKSSVST